MEWMLLPLRRYVEFSGRSRRKEFWMFVLFQFGLGVIATLVDRLLGFGNSVAVHAPGSFAFQQVDNGPVAGLVSLALFVPGLAVSFRRLHDTGRSAWWFLLVIIPLLGWITLLVFFCLDGERRANRWGSDPKGPGGVDGLRGVFS